MALPFHTDEAMTISMYAASVPLFRQMLESMDALLAKAQEHAAARGFDPSVLVHARLFPDMFPLLRQVQIACDFAKGVSCRLAGAEVPAHADDEQDLAGLRGRIAATLEVLAGLDASAFEGCESREVVLRPGTPKERRLDGQAYLLQYGLPQFFFHVTTVYALLRHNGVEVGKRDFMGRW
jgi:uncharacterized protein